MNPITYWPTRDHVLQCIRTEAEELAEPVLLAVHESMELERVGAGEDRLCNEHDLLQHFLTVERPIPIIGRSGVGKSHLIRWLEARLKMHEASSNWHIVRIPKNASLRQVLEILLDRLEGEEFDSARGRIASVGDLLRTEEVADLLLMFMAQQLNRLYEQATDEIAKSRDEARALSTEDKDRLKAISTHARPGQGLSELITDPNFKASLLQPTHCIYQFARRLTQGASDDELVRNEYELKEEDLDFNFNLHDLSAKARQYVSQAQLNTSTNARNSAVRVLNEVLGQATRRAFQHLFKFDGGSFQDLFKDIRRTLKMQERTLVVLVEDMAAISAIEDVLVDGLLEESVRDGEQVLCTLRSAIAVTDGYHGYARRKDTIKTRAIYEWFIREQSGDAGQTSTRILNFCARYLNAARHGSSELTQSWRNRGAAEWPPRWDDVDVDSDVIEAFGYAPSGIPLYPFNRSAIEALADRYCRKGDEPLKFNPRQILNEILLRTLRDHREECRQERFPVAGFGEIAAGAGLTELYVLDEPARCSTFAAIWGYGCHSISELQSELDPKIASTFGLRGMAALLSQQPVVGQKNASTTKNIAANSIKPRAGSAATGDAKPSAQPVGDQVPATVSLWFQRRQQLGQEEARLLRAGLDRMFQQYCRNEWVGLAEKPKIKIGSRIQIEVPFALGNALGWTLKFCDETDFDDPLKAAVLQGAAIALLRYEYINEKTPGIGWRYVDGFVDFLRYQNFASIWVPYAMGLLSLEVRKVIPELMGIQISAAKEVGIIGQDKSGQYVMNVLLQKAEHIAAVTKPAAAPAVREARSRVIQSWNAQRQAWLSLVAFNDHGLDGDLAMDGIAQAEKRRANGQLVSLDRSISDQIAPAIEAFQSLAECTRQEQFYGLLGEMSQMIDNISKDGEHYPTNFSAQEFPSARRFKSMLKNLLDADTWATIKLTLALQKEPDTLRRLQIVNQIDGDRLKQAVEAFDWWKIFYAYVSHRLEANNAEWGAESLHRAQEGIAQLLQEAESSLIGLQGIHRADA
ncbi:protein DpdH [Paraburkholderia diazotrophica]|uniref:Uncharacterized protein n=1 Tax=Paraburkholderia diazotrophica TaxID=667676 RepID=A0A1H6RKA9_9BURK|nr:protein DpdH [Paraburkholderia diazotrophica]SEI52025.1 hypothetical protein SAMN05192539_1002145 [Paraburkholderia diazotrophica]